MTYDALPTQGLSRLFSSLPRPRAVASINPVLLHDHIVHPALCNEAILAGKRIPLTGLDTDNRAGSVKRGS